ncbi:hypothetical protein B1C78_02720 [Thioalkalivibrio denitrificans]|uniref:Uncharacterized protein n=1 Tax=Thioalkalivibrio denitrificans TaxID=108003 RepID=A0A1V3NRU1_9GAMM|nr:hypothetical protein [Thioalkalivibrio denitrificans]OOG27839.1 hypothetical protein B1C78_02720 [Thioalkalivibrio denitrificans]
MDLMEWALVAGAAGVLLGYLLVVRAGFRREFLWGIINLVPVVSLAFVLLYWREARFGFALSILGLLVVAGALYGGADARVEREMARLGHPVEIPMPVQRPWDVQVPNEELVRRMEEELGEPLTMVEEHPYTPAQIRPLPPAGSIRPQERAAPVEREWREAVREELPQLVGERMRLVIAAGGAEREGTLAGVTRLGVFLQQVTRQGTVSFEYRLRDVESMHVWDVKGAAPRIPEPDTDTEIVAPDPTDSDASPPAGEE